MQQIVNLAASRSPWSRTHDMRVPQVDLTSVDDIVDDVPDHAGHAQQAHQQDDAPALGVCR